MVPDAFDEFFVAAAGVAGALIGLLFVAISVNTGWNDPDVKVVHQVRAGVAFSALTDALVIGLVAVIPGINLGAWALPVAIVGFCSTLGLGVYLLAARLEVGKARHLALTVIQCAVFVLQALYAYRLIRHPGDVAAVRELAVLTIIMFLVGISRAWELVGGRTTKLFGTVREVVHDRRSVGPVEPHPGATTEATGPGAGATGS
jgi:hypothetical protein